MKLLLLTAALLAVTPTGPAVQHDIVLADEVKSFDLLGNCSEKGKHVDLRRVMFLENRSITVGNPNEALSISLEGEDVFVKEIGDHSQRREYFNNIGYQVDDTDDLDIELKFAYVEGKLGIYWYETFKHRVYRQGLFLINEKEFFKANDLGLTFLCEGHGGRRTER